MNEYKIIHDQAKQVFYIDLKDNLKAYIKYQLMDEAQIDFTSTFVPQTHRKQGIAAKLVESGFAWADQENLTIKASCWYAAKKLGERSGV